MRRTNGFAPVLLVALALGSQAVGQSLGGGQNLDLAPSDPIIPIPTGHDRMESVGGLYTAYEFVMFRQTNPIQRQLIATRGFVDVDGAVTGDLNGTIVDSDANAPFIIRGPIAPGTRYGSQTPALFTDDLKGQETYQPGFAITIGYKFDSGSAIEAKWTHLRSAKYSASASLNPPDYAVGPILSDTFLFSPVFNYPGEYNGPINKLAIGNPNSVSGIWNGANNMYIEFQQNYDQFDIVGKVPWMQSDSCRVYGRAGFRYAWIWEEFKWRTIAADFNGQTTPQDVAIYTNVVSNRMYGGFVGLGVDQYIGRGFAIGIEGDAAFLIDIAKQRARYSLSDRSTSAKKAASNAAIVPEVNANVNVYWYPWEGVQLRAGYNFMSFFNTIAADTPIAFDFRSLDPNWTNRGVRYLDGINAGICFIF